MFVVLLSTQKAYILSTHARGIRTWKNKNGVVLINKYLVYKNNVVRNFACELKTSKSIVCACSILKILARKIHVSLLRADIKLAVYNIMLLRYTPSHICKLLCHWSRSLRNITLHLHFLKTPKKGHNEGNDGLSLVVDIKMTTLLSYVAVPPSFASI
jgi:hypothetical protein